MIKKVVKVLETIMEHLDKAEASDDPHSYVIDSTDFDVAYGMLNTLITLFEDDEDDQ